MRSQRWIGILALAAIGAAAVVAGPAAAETRTIPVKTGVDLLLEANDDGFMEFSGTIRSSKLCLDDRKVTLLYKASETSPIQHVGSDQTDRKGAFKIDPDHNAFNGFYAASVGKSKAEADGTKYTCRSAKPVFEPF